MDIGDVACLPGLFDDRLPPIFSSKPIMLMPAASQSSTICCLHCFFVVMDDDGFVCYDFGSLLVCIAIFVFIYIRYREPDMDKDFSVIEQIIASLPIAFLLFGILHLSYHLVSWVRGLLATFI